MLNIKFVLIIHQQNSNMCGLKYLDIVPIGAFYVFALKLGQC